MIEEETLYRLGGDNEIRVKFKLVCATHRNLEKMVEQGKFREDLYMRISTLPIHIAPLSIRKQDTPEIIEAMLPRVCDKANLEIPVNFDDLPESFIEYLVNTQFRGNARGIFHRLVRLIVKAPTDDHGRKALTQWKEYLDIDELGSHMASSESTTSIGRPGSSHFPIDIFGPDFPGVTPATLNFQDQIYLEAKRRCRSINQVARVLKVSPSTAYNNLKRIGVVADFQTRRHPATPSTPESTS